MIVVNCSQCKARLEMDDAFAGGVCRCHFCGTIQTVPAAAKRQAGKPSAAAAVPAAKASGVRQTTELDALAAAAAAHGAATEPRPAPSSAPVDYARPAQQKRLGAPMIVALAFIVLLLAAVGWLLTARTTAVSTIGSTPGGGGTPLPVFPPRGDGAESLPPAPPDGSDPPPIAPPTTPNFCGIDLRNARGVVYVLDRGHATADVFDALKEATYHSVRSLKPGQRFQIIFWDNGTDAAAYPRDGLADASPEEIQAARSQFADLIAGGRSSAEGALRRAVQGRPDAIVLVTGKAYEADEAMAKQARLAVKGTAIKVHTVALKSDDGNSFLKQIADQTHGEYRVVSRRDLERSSE